MVQSLINRDAGCRRSLPRHWLSRIAPLMMLLVAALVSQMQGEDSTQPGKSQRPNIVLIMADDLGYGDLGCYNEKSKIDTPNIDRLATQGLRFTDMHSPSAVCTPTRYGLLTGRYAWRTRLKSGVLWGYSPALINTDRPTIASMLKQHGYRTGCVGKWHLGLGKEKKTNYFKPLHPCPNDYGFDYFFGIPASLDMDPYVYVENDRVVKKPTETIKGSRQVRQGGNGFWRGGGIAPGFRHIDVLPKITEKAVGFINTHSEKHSDKPFFLYFPLSAPHTPWLPLEPYRGKSGAGAYGDFVMQVDATVGRILATLKRHHLTENTLVIVTSDNGAHWTPGDKKKFGHLANGHLRGQKADAWEGGHRVPFIARWPGVVEPGSRSNETLCLTDVFATTAAIVEHSLPKNAAEDSFNFLPVLRGDRLVKPVREAVVHHSARGMFAIRNGPWKLILGRGSGGFSRPRVIKPKPGEPKGQLYHLAKDPAESRNLYSQRPEIVKELTDLLEKYKAAGRSRATN